MDAGLSNLATLKAHLLPEPMRARADYDDTLLILGRGTAHLMQRHCNREFARAVDATHVTTAGWRSCFVLPRYPIESLTKVELQTRPTAAWEELTLDDILARIDAESGVVLTDSPLGLVGSSVRFTFTGGWWWSTTEPPSTESQPAGSTALPPDIQLAWLNQCEHVWSQRDRLGMGLAKGPGAQSKAGATELTDATIQALRPYLRHGQ